MTNERLKNFAQRQINGKYENLIKKTFHFKIEFVYGAFYQIICNTSFIVPKNEMIQSIQNNKYPNLIRLIHILAVKKNMVTRICANLIKNNFSR